MISCLSSTASNPQKGGVTVLWRDSHTDDQRGPRPPLSSIYFPICLVGICRRGDSHLVLYAFISLQQAACTWLPYNALYSMRQWWWREPSDANRIVDASEALIPSHNFLGSKTRIDVHANATEIGYKGCVQIKSRFTKFDKDMFSLFSLSRLRNVVCLVPPGYIVNGVF